MNIVTRRRRQQLLKRKEWLNPQQVQEQFGISRTRIRVLCAQGLLPHKLAPSGAPRVHRLVARAWVKAKAIWPRERKQYPKRATDDSHGGAIYLLLDPRPERKRAVRYVGKSENVSKRKSDYARAFKRHDLCHSRPLRHWFAKLERLGFKPIFEVVDQCLFGLNALEQKWIDKGKAKGWPLLNCREGGVGQKLDAGTRKRLSDFGKAKWADPEYVARWKAGMAGVRGKQIELIVERAANKRGMTVEQYQKWRADTRTVNLARHQANMEIAAERKRNREAVRVPLTCKGVAFVPLTNRLWAKIDVADWERVSERHWHANRNGKKWRAISKTKGRIFLHQFISGLPRARAVDGNPLNCRKQNLAESVRLPHAKRSADPDHLRRTLFGMSRALIARPHNVELIAAREGLIRRILECGTIAAV